MSKNKMYSLAFFLAAVLKQGDTYNSVTEYTYSVK